MLAAMKRNFYIAMAVVFVAAVLLEVYGAWLNLAGDSNIAAQMESRTFQLHGARAGVREMHPLRTWRTVNLYSEQMTDVVARVDGMIQASFVERQQSVVAGQTLMQILNEDIPLKILQSESGIARAEAERKRAENSWNRHRLLIEQNATSREKLDEAEAQFHAAEATIRELEAQKAQQELMMERQTITAPISGQVLMIYKQPGTYVQSGTPVMMIGDFSTLWYRTSLPDKEVNDLLPLTEVKDISFPRAEFTKAYGTDYGAGNRGKNEHFPARIVSVEPAIDIPAEMRTVLFAIDNSSGMLEPHTYTRMQLRSSAKTALCIPLSALLGQDKKHVYVLDGDGRLKLREIRTGAEDEQYIEVLSGLREGEVVITSGEKGLYEGMAADVQIEED